MPAEIWKDGVLVETIDDRTPATARAAALDFLAEERWRRETAGVLITAVLSQPFGVPTDAGAQGKIAAARIAADADPAYSANWKVGAGQFVTLSAANVAAMSDAARAYVQGCFDAEKAFSDRLNAAATLAEIDAITHEFAADASWPSRVR
jgi:hypothetical protein